MSPTAALELARYLTAVSGIPVKANASTSVAAPFGKDRDVSVKIVAPSSTWWGRVPHPDPTIQKHGWDGICLLDRMERQHPVYAAVCNLWADKVCANDLNIKPGDASEGKSRWLADAIRKLYQSLPGKHIVNKKAAKGRFYGFTILGKADWRIDEETGLYAPHDVYDIPWKYIDFDADGNAYAKTELSWSLGVPIPNEAIMRFGWGSRFTPWGEPDGAFCYLPLWYAQRVRQFGMNVMEILTHPMPWVDVPVAIQGENFDKLEAGFAAKYQFYVITRTTDSRTTTTFPTLNLLSSGNVGKSENEWLRYYYGEVYQYVLGVQLTQDKTGGSRALEDSRIEIIADKTPPGLQALGQMWQEGFSNQICDINFPSWPKSWRPKWEPEIVGDSLDGFRLTKAIDALLLFGQKRLTDVVATNIVASAGVPMQWAVSMVDSMREARDRDDLVTEEEPRVPQQNEIPTAALYQALSAQMGEMRGQLAAMERRA